MKFNDFSITQPILDALKKLQYQEPTDVQQAVIPLLLKGQDAIVKARTGSGKTAAFAIPIIEQIEWEENKPQCLVLSPTRELAVQIKEDFDMIGTYKRIKALAVFGKQPYKFQIQDLKQKTHVVIGTPGRVLDHLQRGTLDVSKLRYLVIDEADELLKMGFIETIKEILPYLPAERCNCLFSATLQENIQEFADSFIENATHIEIETAPVQIDSYAYEVKEHEKQSFLLKLLVQELPASAIIFAKTKEHVDEVCLALYEQGISVDKLHGGMLQEDRMENLDDFRHGKIQILVASDVASRGIDVKDVEMVINYDLPEEKERFVHRIGRTGRMEASGKAVTFLSEFDSYRRSVIEDFIQAKLHILDAQKIHDVSINKDKIAQLNAKCVRKAKKNVSLKEDIVRLYLHAGKAKKLRAGDIVGAICEVDGVNGDDIGVIQIQEHGSYVDILHGKGHQVCKALQKRTIKGKNIRVEISKQQG